MKYVLCLFLLCSTVQAAQIPQDAEEELLQDWSGGLNTAQEAHKLPVNMSPNMENVLIDEKIGSIVKRNGFVVSGSTRGYETRFNFIFPFNKENGSKEFLVSGSSAVFTTTDFIRYDTIRSSLTTSVILDATQIRNKVWLTNGADPVFTYDGTTVKVLDGTAGTPNVPRGKYIANFHERVWLFNTASNGSALHFSALVSTNGNAIAPDAVDAWPSVNQLNIGQGDGTVGTGLFVYKGRLFPAKESSIYTVFGNSDSSYFASPTSSKDGIVSQDSIQILDDLVYFLGNDGVNAFNGDDSKRISDSIIPDIDLIRKDQTLVLTNLWDKKSDYDKGNYSVGNSTTSQGEFLTNLASASANILDLPSVGANNITLSSSKLSSGFVVINSTDKLGASAKDTFPDNFQSRTGIKFSYNVPENTCDASADIDVTFRNEETGETLAFTTALDGNTGNISHTIAAPNAFSMTRYQILRGSFTTKLDLVGTLNPPSCNVVITTIGFYGGSQSVLGNTTGTYRSEIATLTANTAWGIFDSNLNTNGGSVSFFIRTGTSASALNMPNAVGFSPIAAGSRINAPSTDLYVQWATTMVAANVGQLPTIDDVSIEHTEGSGANSRAISTVWKNRYWLAVSTESSDTFSVIYVKSKNTNANPNAWMKFTGINIRSLGVLDGNLYGGSSTATAMIRLDFGTNDNGSTIIGFYQTPDMFFKRPFFNKNLFEYQVDVNKESGANLKVGTSKNGGMFSDISVSLDGTGRLLRSVNNVSNFGKYFRFRFMNDELDKGLTFNRFSILYQPRQDRNE